MNPKETIGYNIQRNRELKNMKQETLAKLLDISPAALSQIETGKTDIAISRIVQIADALEISFSQLTSTPNQVITIHNSPQSNNHNSHITADPKLIDAVLNLSSKVVALIETNHSSK